MKTKIELNKWQLSFEYKNKLHNILGTVPGNVEIDLEREGLIPDPFFGNNVHLLREFEFIDFTYHCEFFTPEKPKGHETWLILAGVDTIADVYLNDKKILSCKNMFIPHEVEISKYLAPDKKQNKLSVCIKSAVNEAREYERPAANFALPYNYDSIALRKARHSYGWDIMPRMVSAGLWKPVCIETRNPTRVKDLFIQTIKIDNNSAQMKYDWWINLDPSIREIKGLTARFVLSRLGEIKYEETFPLWFTSGQKSFKIKDVDLWWPKGYGESPLYEVSFEIFQNDLLVDIWKGTTGIRTIVLNRSDEINFNGDGEFVFIVNGQKIFIRGSNWVPADALHSRDKDRVIDNLKLFDDLGCNMIRIWGGSVYEDKTFFNFCDEHGILIWQDFMLSCEFPRQDEEFKNLITIEATAIIKQLRNHPSLAIWAGDNEIDYFSAVNNMAPSSNKISRETLASAVCLHDPSRNYLPSSPYFTDVVAKEGPDFKRAPEQHLWGPRDNFKGSFYKNNTAIFASEIGYHGAPNVDSIKRFISPEKLFPWQKNDEWITHAAQPLNDLKGAYSYRIKLMADQVYEYFHFNPENLEDFVLASQISQAEALKFFIESFRIRKGKKTGILWWNVIDGWPQFSDAIVDYYYQKKLAYHFIKRVQQPVCIMFDEPDNWHISLFAVNDTLKEVTGKYTVKKHGSSEIVLSGDYTIAPNDVYKIEQLPIQQSDKNLFQIEWTLNGKTYHNHYTSGNTPFDFTVYKLWLKEIMKTV